MEPVIAIPVVTLATVRLLKPYPVGRFILSEVDALVWDPIVVRALLDERISCNPMLALISPERARKA